jgi:hypothetical protein
MFKKILIFTFFFFVTSGFFGQAHAQMMNTANPAVTIDPTQIQKQQQEEAEGKKLFDALQNKQTTCEQLTESDFEKIGEYSMSQMTGNNTAVHIAMNQRIKQMRGDTGEEQMHIQIGRSVTDCSTTSSQNSTPKGGRFSMMGWNNYGMMNGIFGVGGGFGGFWIVALIVHGIIIFDLILLGIWLWKQIKKK